MNAWLDHEREMEKLKAPLSRKTKLMLAVAALLVTAPGIVWILKGWH